MESDWQRSFILLKPDAVKRALVGRILQRLEQAGLRLRALKLKDVEENLARVHYAAHEGKPYFTPLVELLCSGPVILLCMEGSGAIEVVRKIVGATEPLQALPGTIRGDLCHMSYARSKERLGVIPNLIHASDSPESAEKELDLWFGNNDFVTDYERCDSRFM